MECDATQRSVRVVPPSPGERKGSGSRIGDGAVAVTRLAVAACTAGPDAACHAATQLAQEMLAMTTPMKMNRTL